MKPASQQSPHLIAILVLAVMLGLLLVMHVTSASAERCARETVDVTLLKLI